MFLERSQVKTHTELKYEKDLRMRPTKITDGKKY